MLNGGHQDIVCGPVEFDGNVQVIRSGFYRRNKITVTYSQEVKFNTVFELASKEFMKGEALGCEPPTRCTQCSGCDESGF